MHRVLLITSAAFLLCSVTMVAQEVDGSSQRTAEEGEGNAYIETVDVTVVNVDVYVTDKKGNPIRGLTREDFEIYENKKPVAISNFAAVEGGQAQTAPAPRASRDGATQGPETRLSPQYETAPVPEDQRLHLVVYIDNFNIRPFNRNRVFRRLREFLQSKLARDDRVMLVSYDRSLHVRREFTSDSQLIASALFELESLSGFGVQADSDRRDVVDAILEAQDSNKVTWRTRQYAESVFNDLSFSIDALKEALHWLAGLPGRKAILYVSDGLPMVPGEDLFYMINEKFNDPSALSSAREYDAARRFREVVALANSNRVTFYTIDASGLRVPETYSAQQESVGRDGVMTIGESVYANNLLAPIRMLADETGGQAIYNTNDVGSGLDRIASDFDSYYSLGYTPGHGGTGRYYRIEVKVKRKGLKVRHRDGYRDKPLHIRMEEGTLSSLRFGYASNPLDLMIQLGGGVSVGKDEWEVPIVVSIDLDKIVLVPRQEFHEASLKLYFGAMDERGWVSAIQEYPLPLKISNDHVDALGKEPFVFQDKMRMRSGLHRVAVGLWDEIGAEGSFVTQAITVGGG